jgi:hypothetical protein
VHASAGNCSCSEQQDVVPQPRLIPIGAFLWKKPEMKNLVNCSFK